MVTLLVACGPTVTATPTPAGPTHTPGEPGPGDDWTGAPVVEPPPGLIPAGSQVRVAVDSLNLRNEPRLSSPVHVVLAGGELVLVIEGPRVADGYTWYRVETGIAGGRAYGAGWTAAAGPDGDPFLVYVPPRCPVIGPDELVTSDILVELAGWPALACFGDRQIGFSGTITCHGHGGYEFAEPAWLGAMSPVAPDLDSWIGGLHYEPELQERPECWSVIEGTGQFDHPAAQTCEGVSSNSAIGEEPPWPPPTKAEVVLLCRQQFVVQSFEVVGQQPPPPGWEPPPTIQSGSG
jgi:hypothetical protein